MYWPCGVPQVYAHHGRTQESINGENVDGRTSSELQTSEAGRKTAADQALSSTSVPLALIISVASITASSLYIWSTRPVVVLAVLSEVSEVDWLLRLRNQAVLFKPDATIVVVRTDQGYLITYSVEGDHNNRVLQQNYGHSQSRRQSVLKNFGYGRSGWARRDPPSISTIYQDRCWDPMLFLLQTRS